MNKQEKEKRMQELKEKIEREIVGIKSGLSDNEIELIKLKNGNEK